MIFKLADFLSLHTWLFLLVLIFVSAVINIKAHKKTPIFFWFFIISMIFDRLASFSYVFFETNLALIPLFGLAEYFIWTRVFDKSLGITKYKLLWLIDLFVITVSVLEAVNLAYKDSFFVIPGRSLCNMIVLIILISNYVQTTVNMNGAYIGLYSVLFVYITFNTLYYMLLSLATYWNNEAIFHLWGLMIVILYLFYLLIVICQWNIGKTRTSL